MENVKDIAREILEKNLYSAVVVLMDDEIREAVHGELAPCSETEFLEEYFTRHIAKYGSKLLVV